MNIELQLLITVSLYFLNKYQTDKFETSNTEANITMDTWCKWNLKNESQQFYDFTAMITIWSVLGFVLQNGQQS